MDIRELQDYRLSDAIKFNEKLNPRLWGSDEKLLPDVREKLLAIAEDFKTFLGIDVEVKDITISGSNAAYTYTPHSDIDLHLVADLPRGDTDEVYRELFNAKKYQYNDEHDYKIGPYDVELYVQNANEPHVSQGIYSVLNNDWIKVPSRRKPTVDDISVQSKYEDIGHRVEQAIASGDLAKMDAIATKIKEMRKSGLEQTGEFGPENLAFKILRTNGVLDALRQARHNAKDKQMSLDEDNKEKPKFEYGKFGGLWFPGFNYYGQPNGIANATDSDAEAESVKENVESPQQDIKDIVKTFSKFAANKLNLNTVPTIKLKKDPVWSERNGTFGRYDDATNVMYLSVANRHPVDVLRTLAHELTHRRQDETEELPANAGDTGSHWEDEANAIAGRIMRDFGEQYPEFFKQKPVTESDKLNRRTPTPQEIMRKHGISKQQFLTALRQGIKIELEHTKNPDTAKEIALDHLNERPDYYDVLASANLEEGAKETLGALIAAACMLGAPGCANLNVGARGGIDLARAVYNLKNITRAGTQEELTQELKNYIRAQRGDPQAQNQSSLYQIQRESINESSGYIPTEKEKNDPRFSMALTVDIKPGQTGKEANKLGLQTDSQGRPKLLRSSANRIDESIQLDEVNMSPSALRSFAKSRDAEGIQSGFEAELVFPGLGGDSEDGDYEPDYDEDTRTHSIDDIIDFFEYDDFGYGISGREADRLRAQLEEEYWEWRDSLMMQEFDDRAFDLIRDYIERNEWDEDEQIREYLRVEYPNEDIDKIIKQAREATSTRNTPKEYLEAAEAINQELDARAEQSRDDQDEFYDAALDEFRDDWDTDDASEDSWLRENYRYMSDISDSFNVTWPYILYQGSEGGYNEHAADVLADSLSEAVGMRVVASGEYHATKRSPDTWIIEPDSSLEGNESDDMPAEIVSPPMPLNQTLDMLEKFWDWAHSKGAYTNESTGFHMSVSLPYTGGKTDFLKLALFLGDEYVLQDFGRQANTYAESAMKKIQSKVKQTHNSEQVSNALLLMRNGLTELATRALKIVGQNGFGKYTSINPKDNYIEFRSAGGEDYDRDIKKLQNTLLRYARAMSIAANPSAERNEYNKKLYKLISPNSRNPVLELFAKFASGNISASELKKEWAEAALAKVEPKDNKRVTWKIYDAEKNKYLKGYQYSGYTKPEALALFKQAHSPGSSMEDFEKYMKHMQYELRDVSTNSGRWEIVNRATDEPIEVIAAANNRDAGDLAQQMYSGKGIDYYIQPYNPGNDAEVKPVKPSRRVELAKRIAAGKSKEPEFTHYLRNKQNGRVEHLFRAPSSAKAYEYANQYSLKHTGQYSNFSSGPISSLLPTEIEKAKETMRQQEGNYYIRKTDTGEIVHRFYADNNTEAVGVLNRWGETHPGNFVYGQTRFLDNEPAQTSQASQASQTPAGSDVQWRVTNNQTGDSSIITAPSRLRANSMVIDLARRMGVDFENFTISPVNQQPAPQEGTPVERREGQVTTDAGIPMWEIYDRRSGSALTRFPDHNQTAAWETAQQWLRDAHVPEDRWNEYSMRPLTADQPAASSQPVAGSTQDRQQQRAAGEFTGTWAVVNSITGEELHRFSGVGNVQADANRVAKQWLQTAGLTEPVEVVPIVG